MDSSDWKEIGSFFDMFKGSSAKVRPLLGNTEWVGKLDLKYYEGSDSPKTRTIPFYETPYISESQSARLITYSPVGRSVNSFAYTGANSRNFKVKFNITLPHLYDEGVNLGPGEEATEGMSRGQKRKAILEHTKESVETNLGDKNGGGPSIHYDRHYEETLDEISQRVYKWAQLDSPLLASGSVDAPGAIQREKIIDNITSFVASIRSSTINNANNPVWGAPIVRLTYGILYDNVPCICESYSINYDPMHGFDVRTLMPRVLTISMDLHEVRNYVDEANPAVDHDGHVGWEVLFTGDDANANGRTMDPGGGWKYGK